MKVNDIHNVVSGLDAREVLRRRADKGQSPTADQSSGDGDSLQLSLSAKITNEYNSNPTSDVQPQSEITEQKIVDIRARIASGAYDQPAVMNAIAEQIRDFYGQ